MIELSGDTWLRWENLRRDLAATKRWELAGLFRGHESPGFRHAAKRVLYTGKATAGRFDSENASEESFGCNRGAFWNFARELSSLAGGDPQELTHLAWSNICKIGTAKGNPDDILVNAQADLSVHTLRQEWAELNPTLVVCVGEGYQEQLIYRAFGVTQDHEDGFTKENFSGGTFWTRPALDGLPAFLWTRHPQGKPKEYIDAAGSLAAEILRAARG